jgi:DNA-directed RNA polymerase subunit RPC12/RpoP
MVECPKCGSKVKARKLFFLTNISSINCSVCGSKLRIKNREVSSAIGGSGGAIGAGLGTLLLISYIQSGNLIFLGLFAVLVVAVGVVAWIISGKYVRLELSQHV